MKEKKLLIVERSNAPLDFQVEQSLNENNEHSDSIVLTGLFTSFNTKNRNGRIYESADFLPHVEALREQIESKRLLGELDHPHGFEISLGNVSHVVESLEFDPQQNAIVGKIRLLNTTAGKEAQALVRDGIPLNISSRAAGTVDESGHVKLQQLFTYDLVADPGFANAQLKRVNESYGFGDDDTYRQWLKTQIQSFAGCGTHLAYEARARNADTRVLDVYVLKQGESGYQKGKVKIYILTNPDTDLHNQVLFLVREACTDPTFRPIGDYVEVSYAGVTNADVSCTIQVTYPLKFYDLGAARNNRILAEYKRLLSQQINRPFKFDELCSMLTAKDTDGIYALDAKPTNLTANTYTEPIYPVLGSTLNITSLPFSTVYSNR